MMMEVEMFSRKEGNTRKKRLVKEAKATTKATPALLRCRRRAATATPTQAAAKG